MYKTESERERERVGGMYMYIFEVLKLDCQLDFWMNSCGLIAVSGNI